MKGIVLCTGADHVRRRRTSLPTSFPEENIFGVMDWNMQDVLVDPMFRWDEYLVDMVLDTDLAQV